MHTLVLDLHGGLPSLGAAEVLLYRPRAEGRLAWLTGPPLVEATNDDLQRLAAVVRTHLTRHQVGPWQLVPLLDLPAGGDPLDGSALVDQLNRLQQGIIEPLAPHGLHPQRTIALTLDGLERDHRGIPTDSAARLRWKLDTYGMARVATDVDQHLETPHRAELIALVARHPGLLNEKELTEVAESWVTPERPEGVRLDQRLTTLTPELRARLDETRDTVLRILKTHLAPKADDSDADESRATAHRSRLLLPAVRLAVEQRFAEDIDALRTFAAWQSFDPRATLLQIFRQLQSLEAVTSRTAILRLPLKRQPLPALRRSLLDLAYAVVALADLADQSTLLKAGTRYKTTVDIDEAQLSTLAEAYRQRLDRTAREVGYALDEPLVDSIPLVRDPDCGCDLTLDVRDRFETVDRWSRIGPIRGTDDLRWDTWADSIGEDLSTAEAEADANIAACIRADAARFPSPQPIRLDQPIDAFVQQETEAFRAKQRALLASVVPKPRASWDEMAHAKDIAPRLYSRPVGRVVALWAAGSSAAFAVPYLLEAVATPLPFAENRVWWLVGLGAVGLLVALVVLFGRWLTLRRKWRAVALVAKEALANVQARYRLRTDRLAQGCDLRAARQRLEAAHVAEREAGHRRLRLRFHATQLRHHQRLASSLRDDLSTVLAAPDFDAVPPEAGRGNGLGNGLDPALPVYRNPVYQLTHRPGPPLPPTRVVVNRSEHAVSSPRLAGLHELRLEAE